jgi:uncharacterized Ntn-hydrolase superfamily protein
MTFSIAARDPDTGAFGLAITTSGLCVGARCPFAVAGIGAVLTQHRTDPRLGPLGLRLLAQGLDAEATLAALTGGREESRWRQVAVVDAAGRTAAYHGSEIYSLHGHASADGAIAIGNILRSEAVPQAMLDAFLADRRAPMERRLVAALAAGQAAGGELKPVRSAALLIVRDDPFPWMDIRVDRAADPIAELGDLAAAYASSAVEFRRRVVSPGSVPNDPELVALDAALKRSA